MLSCSCFQHFLKNKLNKNNCLGPQHFPVEELKNYRFGRLETVFIPLRDNPRKNNIIMYLHFMEST